jgi:hypothetical protein
VRAATRGVPVSSYRPTCVAGRPWEPHVRDLANTGGTRLRRSVLALLATALALTAGAVPASGGAGTGIGFGIVQPNHTYAGRTYGEWSAKWWQYAVSVSDPNADCTAHQSGPVWFLAAAQPGQPDRLSCNVPAGKAILVPVINAEWSTLEPGCGNTYQSLLSCAATLIDLVTQRSFSIDGVPVDLGPDPQSQSRFRVQSPPPPFAVDAVDPNILVPPGTGTSVADGIYVLLKPLRPGRHRLVFSGTVTSDGKTYRFGANYSVTVGQRTRSRR